MTAAIFGIIGVVVGGLITWAIEFSVERRRERAELRQAKRLVADELHTMWVHMALIAKGGRAPDFSTEAERTRVLPTHTWEAHKTTLARSLSDDEWEALPTLYYNAESTRLVMMRTPGAKLDSSERQRVAEMAEMAAEFYTLLTGRPPQEP